MDSCENLWFRVCLALGILDSYRSICVLFERISGSFYSETNFAAISRFFLLLSKAGAQISHQKSLTRITIYGRRDIERKEGEKIEIYRTEGNQSDGLQMIVSLRL